MNSGEVGRLVRQIPTHYPFVLVDRIVEHDERGRLVALKNVTGAEDFFAGHFPSQPVMPGVLILEALAQAAGIWLLKTAPDPRRVEIRVVGFDDTKFRRPVLPGDQLRLEVELVHRRGDLVRFRGEVRVGDARARRPASSCRWRRCPIRRSIPSPGSRRKPPSSPGFAWVPSASSEPGSGSGGGRSSSRTW